METQQTGEAVPESNTGNRLTISEGLAELKLIEKKVADRMRRVQENLTSWKHGKDPFESEGGSKTVVAGYMQSVKDLTRRYVAIRSAITHCNLTTPLTVGKQARTIYEWLTWRRDCIGAYSTFLTAIGTKLSQEIRNNAARPTLLQPAEEGGTPQIAELITHLDPAELLSEQDELQEILEKLDGKLSVANATTFLELPPGI